MALASIEQPGAAEQESHMVVRKETDGEQLRKFNPTSAMKPGLSDLSATLVDEVRTSVPPTLPPATEKEKDKEKIEEEEDEVVEEASNKN